MGRFSYAQNILASWSSVHVDTRELIVISKGIDQETGKVHELYGITIRNDPEPVKLLQ